MFPLKQQLLNEYYSLTKKGKYAILENERGDFHEKQKARIKSRL